MNSATIALIIGTAIASNAERKKLKEHPHVDHSWMDQVSDFSPLLLLSYLYTFISAITPALSHCHIVTLPHCITTVLRVMKHASSASVCPPRLVTDIYHLHRFD